MAGGVSKTYESTWVYNPGGERFEDRVGAILSRGINLKETFKQQSLLTAKKAIAFENEQRQQHANNHPANGTTDFYKQTESAPPPVDKRGFVWVTEQGETIGPASQETFTALPPPPTPKHALTTERQKFMASLDATQRSMHMWRKINPGCVESTTKFPTSTYASHFRYESQQLEPLNKERFRQKTDFTAFADQKIRYQQASTAK